MPNPEVLVPILAVLMVFGIPLVAILTSHQRKMAEIMHRNAQNADNAETHMLREEIRELKTLIYQQSIAIDNLARPLNAAREERLHERVGS